MAPLPAQNDASGGDGAAMGGTVRGRRSRRWRRYRRKTAPGAAMAPLSAGCSRGGLLGRLGQLEPRLFGRLALGHERLEGGVELGHRGEVARDGRHLLVQRRLVLVELLDLPLEA